MVTHKACYLKAPSRLSWDRSNRATSSLSTKLKAKGLSEARLWLLMRDMGPSIGMITSLGILGPLWSTVWASCLGHNKSQQTMWLQATKIQWLARPHNLSQYLSVQKVSGSCFKGNQNLFWSQIGVTIAQGHRFRLLQIQCSDVVMISWSFFYSNRTNEVIMKILLKYVLGSSGMSVCTVSGIIIEWGKALL